MEQQIPYEEEEQQPQMYPPYGGMMRQDKADLLDKIRPDTIVDTVRHKLMGEDLQEGRWVKNPYLLDRSLSPTGAWEIANLMLTVSSQNVALSNLNAKDIRTITISIVDAAMEMCLKNWESYGIAGVDQLRFVFEIVRANTFITLKQPEDNGIKRLIQGSVTELRSYSNIEQKSPGLLANIFKSRQMK